MVMQKIHGHTPGGDFSEDTTVHGMVEGSARVPSGGILTVHGLVTGDLVIESDAKAVVYGQVTQSVVNRGRFELYGRVGGTFEDESGDSYMAPQSVIASGG